MLGLTDYRSWVIFILYVAFGCNLGLLVTATKDKDNQYNYNTTTVVLLSECLKLIVSVACAIYDYNSLQAIFSNISNSYKTFLLYFIPAFLYCVYNNLAFVNLAEYDPTTYYILLQFRVVVSALIFQIVFQKKFTRMQWLSMVVLTLGCMIKELDHQQVRGQSGTLSSLPPSLFLILLQVFCSCFAGVYTEYLLKGRRVDFWIQNIFMYVNSILGNLMVLLYTGTLHSALHTDSVNSILQIKVVMLICNNAAMGLVTSMFLKDLNSILKNFACALELLLLAALSWAIFGIPITLCGVLSASSVIFAIQIYSRNPVAIVKLINPKLRKTSDREH